MKNVKFGSLVTFFPSSPSNHLKPPQNYPVFLGKGTMPFFFLSFFLFVSLGATGQAAAHYKAKTSSSCNNYGPTTHSCGNNPIILNMLDTEDRLNKVRISVLASIICTLNNKFGSQDLIFEKDLKWGHGSPDRSETIRNVGLHF